MTTITYKDGVLASDSLMTCGRLRYNNNTQKLFMLKDGTVCAAVGAYANAMSFIRWLNGEEKEKPDLDEEAEIIHLQHDGSLNVYEHGGMYNETCEYQAFGSGAQFALAAMHLGLSASEAVEVAIKFDTASGGAIQTMKCEKQ